MQWPLIISEFKDYFDRDFTFGVNIPDIRDKDIQRAIGEASAIFNPDIYPDETKALAFAYLVAHFIKTDINAANTGSTTSVGIQTGRSAGSVSESLAVPEWALKNPMYSALARTYYGQKYLALTDTYAVGTIVVVGGNTLP
ncbi:phage-related protein [Candidatus Termititenax aidoneus]|uniref:Phage-related protein n=1 Tax=Termititenax aidoneus TaxID=2218524 RepID=A0A388TB00_TERA1|nr:phage-related protein [Candidatus Termititenax aidoneus]